MPNNEKQKLVAEAEQFFKDYDPDDGFDTFDVMAAFAADVLTAERSRVCEWRWDEKQSIGLPDALSRHLFQGNFCPNCGKKIEVKDAK